MTTRGAFLAPVLLPLPSCFVNLPRAFAESFIGARDPSAGAVILELSWETLDGYVQRVGVGWIGGLTRDSEMRSDTFEISAEFARCVGLQEHLLRMPQAFVGVHVVEMVPLASQVNVEPVTEDDWELIQLHAGLMEGEFLRQICVVNDQQVHPIWIHQNIMIRIRVTLPVGMEFARLTPNSEVIVAPKERKPLNTSTTLDREFYYDASLPLRIQKPQYEVKIPQEEVWVHPETFAVLDGAIAKQTTHGQAIVTLWQVPSSGSEAQPTVSPVCVVGRLKCSTTVGRGRILLSSELSTLAATEPQAKASLFHIRVVRVPEVTPRRLLFNSMAVAVDEVVSPVEILARLDSIPVQDGSLLTVTMANGRKFHVVVEVEFDVSQESQELEKQLTNVPVGALQKYCVLGGLHGPVLLPSCIEMGTASAQQLQKLQTLQQLDTVSTISYEKSLEKLARDAPAYKKALQSLRSVLFRDESIARVMLGVKTPGSVLVHGDRGSGKSTLLKSLGDALERDPLSVATPLFVECRSLRGLKMESVKAKLSEIFDQARTNAPALILFDNLDALIPQENEQAGPANDQSRRIAEHLIALLQQSRESMWKATLELHASVKSQLTHMSSSKGENEDKSAIAARARALFEVAGSAMLQKSVAVVAATRSEATLHKALRTCGLLDRSVQVMAPNAEQRESIIHDLLRLKLQSVGGRPRRHWTTHGDNNDVVLDASIDFGLLSSMTEGYSLRDLSNVADRTLHQCFLRCSREATAAASDEIDDVTRPATTHKLVQADFTQAMEGFQPTALVGVDLFKSSVTWGDVGGLSSVRDILKDTLELPTRYAKLYDQAPIKLPAGMLLYGPPGCGKTLLASAVASECGLNFISVKGPEVLNKYIGASEQAIRDLFARAASAAPSVLFLDEFDSIAPRRGADNTGVTDRLVNQLLTFLDGVEDRKGVYVLAATSRPDMIDPALLRPGRLDKSLYCGFPTEMERLDILRAVSRNMELDDDAQAFLHEIAAAPRSHLYSGADLQALMYSAQLELVHEKLGANPTTSNVILKRHVEKAFQGAKPSTSEKARREFDISYAGFSKARMTDFSVADADASANKSHLQHQRTALA